MKHMICSAVSFSLCLMMGAANAQAEAANPEEQAIRQAIASYVNAFNQQDAKSLATHWSEQGEFITPGGKQLQGRQQLQSDFAAYFGKEKNAKLELVGTEIEFLSPNVARETGIARVIVAGQEPRETEYTALHIKTTVGWKIDSLQEHELSVAVSANYEKLQGLEWMIGRWVDDNDGVQVETVGRWTKNQNFIMRSYKVFSDAGVDFEGTQVIGWDAHANVIRSWTFDSDGGFGVGKWSVEENRWTVQSLSVLNDGQRASATNVYELLDNNTFRYSSVGRQAGDTLLPSIEPVTIIRAGSKK